MLEGLEEQDRGEGFALWDRVISESPVVGIILVGCAPPAPKVTAGELFYRRAEVAPSRCSRGEVGGLWMADPHRSRLAVTARFGGDSLYLEWYIYERDPAHWRGFGARLGPSHGARLRHMTR